MLTGKQTKMTPEEKQAFKEKKEIEREIFESKNMGKYVLLYPFSDTMKENYKIEYFGKNSFNNSPYWISEPLLSSQFNPQNRKPNFISNNLNEEIILDENNKNKSIKNKVNKEIFDGDIYK